MPRSAYSYKNITVRPNDGGVLVSGANSSDTAGTANYVEKLNFRRESDGELRREGWEYFAPNGDASNLPDHHLNGAGDTDYPVRMLGSIPWKDQYVLVCAAGHQLYRYSEERAKWVVIAYNLQSLDANPATEGSISVGTVAVVDGSSNAFGTESSGIYWINSEDSPWAIAGGGWAIQNAESERVLGSNAADFVRIGNKRFEFIGLSNYDGDRILVRPIDGELASSDIGEKIYAVRKIPAPIKWEMVTIDGYAIFNNGVDLPIIYRPDWSYASPMVTLRERGIVRCGTIAEFDGRLFIGDVTYVHEDDFNTLFNVNAYEWSSSTWSGYDSRIHENLSSYVSSLPNESSLPRGSGDVIPYLDPYFIPELVHPEVRLIRLQYAMEYSASFLVDNYRETGLTAAPYLFSQIYEGTMNEGSASFKLSAKIADDENSTIYSPGLIPVEAMALRVGDEVAISGGGLDGGTLNTTIASIGTVDSGTYIGVADTALGDLDPVWSADSSYNQGDQVRFFGVKAAGTIVVSGTAENTTITIPYWDGQGVQLGGGGVGTPVSLVSGEEDLTADPPTWSNGLGEAATAKITLNGVPTAGDKVVIPIQTGGQIQYVYGTEDFTANPPTWGGTTAELAAQSLLDCIVGTGGNNHVNELSGTIDGAEVTLTFKSRGTLGNINITDQGVQIAVDDFSGGVDDLTASEQAESLKRAIDASILPVTVELQNTPGILAVTSSYYGDTLNTENIQTSNASVTVSGFSGGENGVATTFEAQTSIAANQPSPVVGPSSNWAVAVEVLPSKLVLLKEPDVSSEDVATQVIASDEKNFPEDGSRILKMLRLNDRLVVYRESGYLFIERGGSTDAFFFEERYRGDAVATFRNTVTAIGEGRHMFVGHDGPYYLDSASLEPKRFDGLRTGPEFWRLVGKAQQEYMFTSRNALTDEIFISTPLSDAGDWGVIALDETTGTTSLMDASVTSAANLRPVEGMSTTWFVMGMHTSATPTYIGSELSDSAYGSRLMRYGYGPLESGSKYQIFTRPDGDYDSILKFGLTDFGDRFSEKDLRSYIIHFSDIFENAATAEVSIKTSSSAPNELIDEVTETLSDTKDENMVPLFARGNFFQDAITVTGVGVGVKILGRTFDVKGVNSKQASQASGVGGDA